MVKQATEGPMVKLTLGYVFLSNGALLHFGGVFLTQNGGFGIFFPYILFLRSGVL